MKRRECDKETLIGHKFLRYFTVVETRDRDSTQGRNGGHAPSQLRMETYH
jgi:hypothetical protein